MELLVETVEEKELSEYEIERNKPMPSLNHGYVQHRLSMFLGFKYLSNYTILTEVEIEMPEKPNSVPDLMIYPKIEIDFLEDKVILKEIPLTTIEILSSTQTEKELIEKAKRYFAAGVKSCWIVLPVFKAIAVFSSPKQKQVFTENTILKDEITGIELSLADVFA